MSIGIGLPGGRFKSILDRNTPVPSTRKYSVLTTRDNQDELELTIFQGDSEVAQNNEYLGTLVLKGIPKGPKGTVQIEVSFEVSNESTLTVRAKETSRGREVSSTFSTKDTPASVRAKLEGGAASRNGRATPKPESKPSGTISLPVSAQEGSGGLFGWFRRLFGD
jgi:molecular chaperone DnaK